ncbi:MAG: hypothetical protein KDA24_04480 [Deltaproteobacteria bacterium]|nr:hypothetical protein [Deltaproteobacteria bacterium]
MDFQLPRSAAANEPTTLPLPFPDQPVELGELPDGAANEPPVPAEGVVPPPMVGTQPARAPRFDWEPAWRGQDARLEREALFARLSTRWREERRRRYLEAVLSAQPEHELPFRPYGDPVTRPVAG